MNDLIDPDRDCHCHLCAPNSEDDGCLDWRDGTARLVTEHGWSVVAIDGHDDVPPWVFTVGLWHTYGSPEVAMFGLGRTDMQAWVNRLGSQIKNGRPLRLDRPVDDVLDGFPLAARPVQPAWYSRLFESAVNFYQQPPLPIVQLVWPDRHGHFPWQEGSGDNCRADQPSLWVTPESHEPSIWTDLDDITPWPYPEDGARTQVTVNWITEGSNPISGVVRETDGSWQFLDGGEIDKKDIRVVHLHHLVARHPRIREVADLRRGEQAWLDANGSWVRSAL
ncbi:DUF4262 domain-containing protein [Actinoplanes bogorensis]|uniref:DUF4262 domain-containing protein n=1 Tax=Paractinoplanes bogorensis TaxID=1610840 RepID=A0ABS5YVJ8_9ACTN|nr:DUF4262 domain-containing protein [Actinoplanes bogorensis]MBU2667469.1 DUF4262 domain-containing protein [Actinoplanes bogorensis]